MRSIKKKRKKKKQPIDVGLILLTVLLSTVGCLALGVLVSWLRWLLLVSGGFNMLIGMGLTGYILYAYDDEDLFGGIETAPKTFTAAFVGFLGFGELILYTVLAVRGR